jgi:flagellar biosynthesis/type III secretory pathway chaperone
MQTYTDDAGVAHAIVTADLAAVRQLRALLLEERAALTRREPDVLNAVVQRKLQCLAQLQQSEDARTRLLARHRGSDWAALLGALDPALAAPWEELRAALQQVAELNRVNERIVARTRRSTERLLSMLRGQFDPVGVYDRSGQARAYSDNRPITSA